MIFSNNKLITAVVVSTAFLSGFALMGFEMFGVRVLAPFFGSGTPVWGAVISVVMTGMGLGYAYGGRLADSRPAVSTVAALLLPAALLMCFFPLYGKPVCRLVDSICSDRRSAALLASALLFPLIVFFLGAVSPLLVKLKVVSMSEVGVGSGIVYASGTAGGVVGTL
ncbi:MAG: hypothetical protein GXP32_01270, partial [Kiritimatiellaeota bacterium]|nr:hypothetical protein [Kiritimatiellota bacterium]